MGHDEDYAARLRQQREGNPNLPSASNFAERTADERHAIESSGPPAASGGSAIMAALFLIGMLVYNLWPDAPPRGLPPPPSAQPRPAAVRVPADMPHYTLTARGNSYTAGLPSLAQVRKVITGDAPAQTLARQTAAFDILMNAMDSLMGPRAFDPKDKTKAEQDLYRAYREARDANIAATKPFAPADRKAWFLALSQLNKSAAFHRHVLERTTSAAWRTAHITNWRVVAAVSGPIPGATAKAGL
jgi:hypothetical protein